ncbi:hypothetical protein BDV96DRAFT_645575 [Lophiotrema nucula]|uniref:Uncharacterized protein n=1 Tax=Lophiotrema nucula TaxID=690887 RepID=A0A6A5Z9V4_9PLEO|nr:hypothetical protein BDV96DRAFT_645575 [Lophiotrema nucula]
MAPSPPKSAPQPFEQTWHETDTRAFDPASLLMSRAPRAWDRKVQTKRSRDGKEKKVYRRYGLRSQPGNGASGEDEQEELQDPHSRATKKLRVRSDDTDELVAPAKTKTHASKGTRFDRRKSVLPRKRIATRRRTLEAVDEDQDIEEDTPDRAEHGEDSVKDLDSRVQDEMAISRRRSSRRNTSTFTFTVQKPRDAARRKSTGYLTGEPVLKSLPEMKTRERAKSPKALGSAPMPAPIKKQVAKVMVCIPSPRARNAVSADPPVPPVRSTPSVLVYDSDVGAPGDAMELETNEFEESSILLMEGELDRIGGSVELMTTLASRSVAGEASEENPVFDQQASLQDAITQDAQSQLDVIDAQDAEMSDITLDIFGSSPQTHEVTVDIEKGVESELPIEDVTATEESLQLEIQQEVEMLKPEDERRALGSPLNTPVRLQEEDEVEQEVAHTPHQDILIRNADEMIQSHEQKVQHEEENASNTGDSYELVQTSSPKDEQAQTASKESISYPEDIPEISADDIAAGLTLDLSLSLHSISPSRQLRSSPPPTPVSPPDDVTMTMPLDDDTALLKDFLTRAAQSKANKAAVVHRRESLQNRRDSGVVRHALASPRKVLEDKDPNSPSKYDNDVTLDLSQTLTLNMGQQLPLSPSADQVMGEDEDDTKSLKSSRRSTRPRKSRLPAYTSGQQQPQGPTNISVRRADGGEPIVLKKTEAQELGLLTRNNTRKNKQGALAVNMRLLKMKAEAKGITFDDAIPDPDPEPKAGKKNVQWDTTLAYFQEDTGGLTRTGRDAERRSLETPDELSMSITTSLSKSKSRISKVKGASSTPKTRRVRGLGASNGTPGKGLLAPAYLLPDEVADEKEKEEPEPQKLPKASSKVKKMNAAPTTTTLEPLSVTAPKETKLPAFDVAPANIEPTKASQSVKERKSKLATPKKLKLPQTVSLAPNVPSEGKENQQLLLSPPKKKKGLQLPQVIVPPVMDSGLPRRRPTRKL